MKKNKRTIKDILLWVDQLKKQGKSIQSNYYRTMDDSSDIMETFEEQAALLAIHEEELVRRVFFFGADMTGLCRCFNELDGDYVLCYIGRGANPEWDEILLSSGWKPYRTYIRTSIPINEIRQRERQTEIGRMLETQYNPELGRLAEEADVSAVRRLLLERFDPLANEVMTTEQLIEAVHRKEIWLYWENNMKEIDTLYIYRVEGKKRYGAITYNRLSADYLYSIVRRADELSESEHDLKIHYGWIREDNRQIIRSLKARNLYETDGMKEYIFTRGQDK